MSGIEINTFSVDPREYYFFIEVFKEAVQRKKRDPKDLQDSSKILAVPKELLIILFNNLCVKHVSMPKSC